MSRTDTALVIHPEGPVPVIIAQIAKQCDKQWVRPQVRILTDSSRSTPRSDGLHRNGVQIRAIVTFHEDAEKEHTGVASFVWENPRIYTTEAVHYV